VLQNFPANRHIETSGRELICFQISLNLRGEHWVSFKLFFGNINSHQAGFASEINVGGRATSGFEDYPFGIPRQEIVENVLKIGDFLDHFYIQSAVVLRTGMLCRESGSLACPDFMLYAGESSR